MTRCLLIAGPSFLGRHLIERLGRAHFEVLATSRQPGPGIDRVCDLLQPHELDGLLAETRPDWILSCAGVTRHDPEGARKLHVEGTANLFNAVKLQCPQARLVIMGSAAEYGQVPVSCLPIQESCSPGPVSDLGATKHDQTQLAYREAVQCGLDIVSLRPFNIIGPGQPEQYLAGNLIRRLISVQKASRREAMTLVNGDCTRDFVDVRDVADAVVQVIQRLPARPGKLQVFNVCTGCETSVRKLARHLCDLAGGCELIDANEPSPSAVIDRSCGDPRQLQNSVGWKPSIDWQDSLRDAWNEAIQGRLTQLSFNPAA